MSSLFSSIAIASSMIDAIKMSYILLISKRVIDLSAKMSLEILITCNIWKALPFRLPQQSIIHVRAWYTLWSQILAV